MWPKCFIELIQPEVDNNNLPHILEINKTTKTW